MIKIIIEYISVRVEKNELAMQGNYEKATIARDTERALLEKIYTQLSNEKYEYPKAVNFLNDYIYQKYDILILEKDKISEIKSTLRALKLKELGI